jgi:hypothetical protein
MRGARCALLVLSLGAAGLLAACNDSDRSEVKTEAPPTPSSADFDLYAKSLVENYSCEVKPAAEVDFVSFTFASDQDTAPPADTSTITAGCTT